MNLKITAGEPGRRAFMAGHAALVWLDGVEVSSSVSRIVLTVDSSQAIQAEVTFFATAVDVEVPADVKAALALPAPNEP